MVDLLRQAPSLSNALPPAPAHLVWSSTWIFLWSGCNSCPMTGFTLNIPESGHDSAADDTKWAGTASVYGPKWARLPLLTLGTLGMQIVWSVEMGYGVPFAAGLQRRR